SHELDFEFGLTRSGLPDGLVLVAGGIDLDHSAVADVDLGALGAALDPGGELVALAGGIQRIEGPPERAANEVERNLGAVFGPVGFDDAGFRRLRLDEESGLLPEFAQHLPDLLGRQVRDQPTV